MLYNIDANKPFLENFAEGFYHRYQSQPLLISKTRIFLPNKRAGRALFKILALKDFAPQIIPKITSIGDFESEDESLILSYQSTEKKISPLTLRLIIAKLLQNRLPYYQTNSKEAFSLASSLESFYFELIKEETDLNFAKKIFTEELTRSDNKLLSYLMVILEDLPQHLKINKLIDPITYRYNSLNLICNLWQKNPPDYPVIIAAPNEFSASMCNFIQTVNQLAQGSIIFKNLSPTHAEETFSSLNFRSTYKYIFDKLNLSIANITPWHNTQNYENKNLSFIEKLFDDNNFSKKDNVTNIPNIELIFCKNEFETAASIAVSIKQQLNQNPSIALITHDKNLRRKLLINLTRWNIHINDSAGIEINTTPIGSFLKLCLHAVQENFSDLSLLTLLKHPFATLGNIRADLRKKIRTIEFHDRQQSIFNRISCEEKEQTRSKLINLSSPFNDLLQNHSSLKELLQEHLNFAQQISTFVNEQDIQKTFLWHGEEGNQVKEFFDTLLQSTNNYGSIHGKAYEAVYDNLLFNQIIRKSVNISDKIHILTPEEAHLLSFDYVVIADLEDNILNDIFTCPWANLKLREKLNLKSVEKLIRQNREVMFNLLLANQVTFFHSHQKAGKISLEPKLNVKIKALLKKYQLAYTNPDNTTLLNWVQALSLPSSQNHISAPSPINKLILKNQKITVTQVGKLMQDPYAFYAEEMLHLKAIAPLYKDYLILEFGIFIHTIIHISLTTHSDSWHKYIVEIAQSKINTLPLSSDIKVIWLHRIKRIVQFLSENLILQGKILSEVKGGYILENNHLLEAKADLIIENGQSIQIIDFKTGFIPTHKLIERGLYPQLPLEGLIIEKNGFHEIASPDLNKELIYVKITGTEPPGEIVVIKDSDTLIKNAATGLIQLMDIFMTKSYPYLPNPYYDNNTFAKDYLHLSRLKEWH
jgi:ATP-dependent helicase/nuclease subunit B